MAHDGAPGIGADEEGSPVILGFKINLPLAELAVFILLSSNAFSDCRAVLANNTLLAKIFH